MSDMRNWRKAIEEMFNDEIDAGAANRPADGEYEICPICNMEDQNCKKCGGEGIIDITGEYKIPDFSKMTERNEHAKIKMTPADLTDPDDDGLVDRPESEKDVQKHLKKVAKKYDVEFVKDFAAYNNPKKVKESEKPYATMDDGPDSYLYKKSKKQKLVGEEECNEDEIEESTMDKEMQELLRLAGMYVKPQVFEMDNADGEESPLTNASDSVAAQHKEPKKDHSKFDNKDGEKSVLSENEEEWIEAVRSAMEYIDADHELAYDVAAENGQMFDNVKHMSWFIDEVANKVIEAGLVGVPPVMDDTMETDPMASYYDDGGDFEDDDFDDDSFYVDEGAVDEDLLLKPKDAPEYDDEESYEEYDEEDVTNEEGIIGGLIGLGLGAAGAYGAAKNTPLSGDKATVGNYMKNFGKGMVGVGLRDKKCTIRVHNEEAYYALADEFGPELDFGYGKNDVVVPCDETTASDFLVGFGFKPDIDFETDVCVDEDLNNGYRNQRKFDGQDFFPSGETSNVSKDRGPAGAKHGDNPMYTRAKVKESKDLYETMRQAYRRHRLK